MKMELGRALVPGIGGGGLGGGGDGAFVHPSHLSASQSGCSAG